MGKPENMPPSLTVAKAFMKNNNQNVAPTGDDLDKSGTEVGSSIGNLSHGEPAVARHGCPDQYPDNVDSQETSRAFAGSPTHSSSPKEIAESICGQIQWTTKAQGYVTCPGKNLHTSKDGRQDCILYLTPVAALNCFHGSCEAVRKETVSRLRQALASNQVMVGRPRLTSEQRKQIAEEAALKRLGTKIRHARNQIMAENAWSVAELKASNPACLPVDAREHWKLLLAACYRPEEVLWIGERFHSGDRYGEGHFRTCSEWLDESQCPGPLICPSTFKPGSVARSKDQVKTQPYLVIESDTLSKDDSCRVFKWAMTRLKMELVAVVDTGNKSLHAWFKRPDSIPFKELEVALTELGCDKKTLQPSQPVRLPGYLREAKYQHLVYLQKESSI